MSGERPQETYVQSVLDLFPNFKNNLFITWPSSRLMSTLVFYAECKNSTIRNIQYFKSI